MNKQLNTSKLNKAIEMQKKTKLQLAAECGISRVTLDTVLKGGEIGLHKFLKIVNNLGLSIADLFDEQPKSESSVHTATADNGSVAVAGNATAHHITATASDTAVLEERIKSLEALITEKERLIQVLMSAHK